MYRMRPFPVLQMSDRRIYCYHTIQRDGSCTEQVQFDYNEATITDAQKSSTNPEDLKSCLEAAVIPEAYKDFLTDAQIVGRELISVFFVHIVR